MAAAARGPPPAQTTRRARDTRARRDARAGLALVSPTVIVVLVMVVLPVLWALILSFQRIRLLQIRRLDVLGGEYTLRNYDLLFSLVGVLLGDPGHAAVLRVRDGRARSSSGLIAALLVRRPFRGRGLVRGVMLLPWVAPVVAITFIWRVLLSPQLGLRQRGRHRRARLGLADPVPQPGARARSRCSG